MVLLPCCEYLYCHPWVFNVHWRLAHSHLSPGDFTEPLQACLSAPSSASTHSCWSKGTCSDYSRVIPIYHVPGATPYWYYEEESLSHLILAFSRFSFWPLSTKSGGKQASLGGGSFHPQRWIPLYPIHSWWDQRVTNWEGITGGRKLPQVLGSISRVSAEKHSAWRSAHLPTYFPFTKAHCFPTHRVRLCLNDKTVFFKPVWARGICISKQNV